MDGEEEFYYNEIEVPMVVKSKQNNNNSSNGNITNNNNTLNGTIKTNGLVRVQQNGHGIGSHPMMRSIPHITMHQSVMSVQPLALSRVSTVSGQNISYVLARDQVYSIKLCFF